MGKLGIDDDLNEIGVEESK